MKDAEIFEVEIQDVFNYRFSYGGQSPYFKGLANGKLVASKCTQCGFVWLPLRPTCSKCYANAEVMELSGEGEVLCSLVLVAPPPHLAHIKSPVASSLIRPDGADTCIKAMVVSESGVFAKGTRVKAKFMGEVKTIADFYFVTM
jgi:uncharacterized OB-fold protein